MSGVVMGLLGLVAVTMCMSMTVSAAQQPGAYDVHQQAEKRDRNRLAGLAVNRRHDAPDGLVADEKRNQSQHDGAGETGEITQLAGTEAEARVARVLAGEGVGQRRN